MFAERRDEMYEGCNIWLNFGDFHLFVDLQYLLCHTVSAECSEHGIEGINWMGLEHCIRAGIEEIQSDRNILFSHQLVDFLVFLGSIPGVSFDPELGFGNHVVDFCGSLAESFDDSGDGCDLGLYLLIEHFGVSFDDCVDWFLCSGSSHREDDVVVETGGGHKTITLHVMINRDNRPKITLLHQAGYVSFI